MVEGEISFGRFLNLARRELRRDETLVRLGSRARDIHCVLGEADVPGISFAPRRPWLRKVSAPSSLDGAPLRAATPAAGLCSSSCTFCEAVTARRAGLRCQRSLPVAMRV